MNKSNTKSKKAKIIGIFSVLIFVFLFINPYAVEASISFVRDDVLDTGGQGPKDSLSADFNNDGFDDFIITRHLADDWSKEGKAVVYINDGTGKFDKIYSFNAGFRPWGVTKGDFNQDGNIDLAFTEGVRSVNKPIFGTSICGAGVGLPIFLGSGNGNFSFSHCLSASELPIGIEQADINNDGQADLIVSNNVNDYMSVYLGNGDGSFSNEQKVQIGYGLLEDFSLADFDKDGNIDVAVNHQGNYDSVLFGNGDGTFTNPVRLLSGFYAGSLTVGDVTSDGWADVVVTERWDNHVTVFVNTGNRSFNSFLHYTISGRGKSAYVQDINKDGFNDLIVANSDQSSVSILLGSVNGLNPSQIIIPVGTQPQTIALGDWNNDSWIDMAIADYNFGEDATIDILNQIPSIQPTPSPSPQPTALPTSVPIVPTATPIPIVPTSTPTPVPTVSIVSPTPSATAYQDTITIIKATYRIKDNKLVVRADSFVGDKATLTVKQKDTGLVYGTMKYSAKKGYFIFAQKKVADPNGVILVTSSYGGKAISPIRYR